MIVGVKRTVVEIKGLTMKHNRHKAWIVQVDAGPYELYHEVCCKCGTLEKLHGVDG